MKKTTKAAVLLLLASLFLIPAPIHAAQEAKSLSLSAKAAFLYEVQSQTVLFAKNENARMPMASTTKIMTALAALSVLSLDDVFCIPREAVGIEGSSAYYRAGETVKIRDLFYALLLQSANDAAVAIALAADGSLDAFVARMNRLADEMGLKDTHFANPHGLHAEEHYTTARELALIASKALAHPFLREVVRTKVYRSESSEQTRVFVNHNKLLSRSELAIGVKTGFTKASGRCLVGGAEGEGMTLVSVTLCAPDDWCDHEAMWKYAFDTFSLKTYAEEGAFIANAPIMGSYLPYVTISNREPLRFLVKKSESPVELHAQINPFPAPAPIETDTVLGYLILTQNGKELSRVPLYPIHFIPKVTILKK